jgi:DNA-binding protein HU-beta
MNKTELITAIAEKAGLSKADSEKALNAAIDVVNSELQAGGQVQLTGIATLSVAKQPAREGRNPATGETIKIAAKNVVKFKAGSKLKELVNTKPAKSKKKK